MTASSDTFERTARLRPMSASSHPLFRRLLLLFTVVPVVELALLVWLGQRIGFWATVGLILVTALVGSYLAQREGLSALARFRAKLRQGGMPGDELTDGILILIAGALLLTPGVLTDVVGFMGLFPPTRAAIKRVVLQRVRSGSLGDTVRVHTWASGPNVEDGPSSPASDAASRAAEAGENVIDVEYEEVEPRPRS